MQLSPPPPSTPSSGTAIVWGVAVRQRSRHENIDSPAKVSFFAHPPHAHSTRADYCNSRNNTCTLFSQLWTVASMRANSARFTSDVKAAVVSRREILLLADVAVTDARGLHPRHVPLQRQPRCSDALLTLLTPRLHQPTNQPPGSCRCADHSPFTTEPPPSPCAALLVSLVRHCSREYLLMQTALVAT